MPEHCVECLAYSSLNKRVGIALNLRNPTLADAILDRLVHNAYKLTLKGESLRKRTAKLTAAKAKE